jgi:hypothetical protein
MFEIKFAYVTNDTAEKKYYKSPLSVYNTM